MKTLNLTIGSILILGISAYEYIEPPSPTPKETIPESLSPKEIISKIPETQIIPQPNFQEPNLKTVSIFEKQPKTPNYPTQDQIRITQMSDLLKSGEKDAWKNYNELCLQATFPPKIGMTIYESRASTWCFPYSRNITRNKNGEYVQEIYYQKDANGDYSPNYSKRQYLYFENNILVSIQE